MTKVRVASNTRIPLSSRKSLEISQLKLDQRELMGADVDLEAFKLQIRNAIPVDIISNITDAKILRTISGASTLTVDVLDEHRTLLRSGKLVQKQDVQIEGLWFRLKNIKKQGDMISLIFEDREVAVLRTYAQPIKASANTSRKQITRAQFILQMIKEPVEFNIPWYIPELMIKQPISGETVGAPAALIAYNNAHPTLGIDAGSVSGKHLLLKNKNYADATQLKNLNTILDQAAAQLAPRPVAVMTVMAAIQESDVTNLPYTVTNPNHRGVFQQDAQFWPASGDVATDAKAFVKACKLAWAQRSPGEHYGDIIDSFQKSGLPKLYDLWRAHAETIVTAYGMPNSTLAETNNSRVSTASGGDYEYYRGIMPVQGQKKWLPEDSWTCIQRLASEVNFRAYFVSGTFYYVAEDDLFAAKTRASIYEGQDGVDYIDGDYDENKKVGQAEVTCRIGRWNAPPGSVVELNDMGVWDGRWLVSDVERSLFNDEGTITLEKPLPILPEPVSDSMQSSAVNYSSLGNVNLKTVGGRSATSAAFGGTIPKDQIGTRDGIIAIVEKALAEQAKKPYIWHETRPMAGTLWSDFAHTNTDCSAFCILVYKEAGCDDPSGSAYNYNGYGSTGSIVANGNNWVKNPYPGDFVMFGPQQQTPGVIPQHMGIYMGNDTVVCLDGGNNYPGGIFKNAISTFTLPVVGYIRVLNNLNISSKFSGTRVG